MSISVTVSGVDSTSVVLSPVLTELVSISGDSSVDVVASSDNNATITVSSGNPIGITSNYSNFVTGQVVRPPEIADFLTENQINTKITTATGDYNTLAANTFYLDSNPSGFITGVDLSELEAATGNLDTRVNSNTANIVTANEDIEANTSSIEDNSDAIADNTDNINNLTGVTGNFITYSETGLFYASSNPSGFITGVDLSSYVQDSETGLFLVSGEDASISALQVGSTPVFPYTRTVKLHDDGVQFGARLALIGTTDNGFPGIEMVTDGDISKRTLIRHEGEGSNDYGISFFTTNNGVVAEKVRFDGDGNVGIGTTSPDQILHINRDQNAATNIKIENSNVGANVSAGMNFHSATADGWLILHGANRTTSRYGLSLADWVELTHGASDDLNGIVIGTRTDIPVVIGANNNEIARFTDNGVGIGTTSPTEALEVNGNILATSGDVSAQLSVLGDNPDYPRAGFKINSDGNAVNYGFSIRNDSATDSTTFLEIVNAADYSASTARALITQSPTAFTIRSAKDNGNVAGTAMVFSTKGNQDAAITIPSDSTNVNFGGNVGIGTATPAAKLHIAGAAQNSYIEPRVENTAAVGAAGFAFINSNQEWKMGVNTADTFRIRDNDASTNPFVIEAGGAPDDSFHMDSNGNVGIGSTTPAAKLDVIGGILASTLGVGGAPDANIDLHVKSDSAKFLVENTLAGGEWVRFSAGTLGSAMKFSNAGNFGIGPVATKTDTSIPTAFSMTSVGDIGMGTTTPSTRLEVVGEITTAGLISSDNIRIEDNTKGLTLMSTTSTRYGLKYGLAGVLGGSDHLMLTNREVSGDVLFGTSPGGGGDNEEERMRITSDGNVGIGTATPLVKLHVEGKGFFEDALAFTANQSTPAISNSIYRPANNSIAIATNSTERLRVTDNGVGIGTASPDELLHLEATAIAGREVLMKANVSDAGNDHFGISNGTSVNNNFAPSFYGYKDSTYGNGYIYSLNFRGLVPDAQDTTQTNRFGIVHFEAYKTNNAADPNNGTFNSLTNRKLFTFSNGGNTVLEIDADNTVTISQDLSVSGDSSFSNRPTVNGTGVLLSGEGGGGTVENVVHTTGDQTISGTKSFGKISLSENSFVTETGSFTIGSTHRGATVLLENSAPMTVTIPAQVSGHTTTFIAETSNSVVFATGAGISGFNSFNSANQIAGIYGQAQIIFKSPEYAFLGGNVV
jgi:hypothetical protein